MLDALPAPVALRNLVAEGGRELFEQVRTAPPVGLCVGAARRGFLSGPRPRRDRALARGHIRYPDAARLVGTSPFSRGVAPLSALAFPRALYQDPPCATTRVGQPPPTGSTAEGPSLREEQCRPQLEKYIKNWSLCRGRRRQGGSRQRAKRSRKSRCYP